VDLSDEVELYVDLNGEEEQNEEHGVELNDVEQSCEALNDGELNDEVHDHEDHVDHEEAFFLFFFYIDFFIRFF
jgi:hypothetical protein